MVNRYREVLMTYLRRPFSSWRAALWPALIVWAVFSDGGGRPGHIGIGSVTNGVLYLSGLLWLHFRQQMVHPPRATIPNYIQTSTVVFVSLGLLAVAGPPLVLSVTHGFRAGLFFALAVYIFGLVGWAIAANTLSVVIVCAAALFGTLDYLGLLWGVSDTVHWAAPPCLLGGGMAAGIWAIWKLSHITEDQRGYGRMADESYDLASFGRSVRRFFGHFLRPATNVRHVDGQNGATQITYGMPMALDGILAGTLRRWQHTWLMAPFLAPALFVLCYAASIVGYGLIHSPLEMAHNFQEIIPFAAMLPLIVSARWQAGWSCIAVESLRPQSRARFARGIFLTIAFQILLAWLIFAATVWLVVVIVDHGLRDTATLTLDLMATGMIQPLACAVVCWRLPHSTRAVSFLTFALLFMAMGMSTTVIFWGTFQAISVAAVLMALGLILIPFIYRHWLNMEMG